MKFSIKEFVGKISQIVCLGDGLNVSCACLGEKLPFDDWEPDAPIAFYQDDDGDIEPIMLVFGRADLSTEVCILVAKFEDEDECELSLLLPAAFTDVIRSISVTRDKSGEHAEDERFYHIDSNLEMDEAISLIKKGCEALRGLS